MLQMTTILFLIASSTLAVIHNLAIKLYLYWQIWWFDIPMHGLGGAVVALGLFTARDLGFFPNKFLKPIPVLVLVMLVALLWEGFELVAGIPMEADYLFDTTLDLILGFLGGVVGYLVGNSVRKLR